MQSHLNSMRNPEKESQVFIRKTSQESSAKANQPNQIRTNPEKKGIKVTRSIHNPKQRITMGINRRNHKGVNRKGANLDIYDRYSHGGAGENIPRV